MCHTHQSSGRWVGLNSDKQEEKQPHWRSSKRRIRSTKESSSQRKKISHWRSSKKKIPNTKERSRTKKTEWQENAILRFQYLTEKTHTNSSCLFEIVLYIWFTVFNSFSPHSSLSVVTFCLLITLSHFLNFRYIVIRFFHILRNKCVYSTTLNDSCTKNFLLLIICKISAFDYNRTSARYRHINEM